MKLKQSWRRAVQACERRLSARLFNVVARCVVVVWCLTWAGRPAVAQINLCNNATPTNVTALRTCNAVVVTWAVDSSTFSWFIYRNTVNSPSGTNFVRIAYVGSLGTNVGNPSGYLDTTAPDTQTYWYWVQSYDNAPGCGAGALSDPALASPFLTGPPGMQTFTDCSHVDVLLSVPQLLRATSVDVYRGVDTNFQCCAVHVGTISDPMDNAPVFYHDTNAVLGVTYYYWAQVNYGLLCPGPVGGPVSGYRRFPIDPPANFIAQSAPPCGVNLSFDPVPGAIAYPVFRSETTDPADALYIGSGNEVFGGTNLNYYDGFGIQGHTYWYWVAAQPDDSTCISSMSGPQGPFTGASPPPPANLTAVVDGPCARVHLTWPAAPGASHYRVYARCCDAPFNAVGFVGSDEPTEFDDYPAPGKEFDYQVRSIGASGCEGAPSPSAVATVPTNPPPGSGLAPNGLSATVADGCFGIAVSWHDVPGAIYYIVYRSEQDDPTTSEVIDTENVNHSIDYGVQENTPYFYWVRSVSATGCGSLLSSSVSGTTSPDTGNNQRVSGVDVFGGGPVLVGSTVVLNVDPVGSGPFSYQWRKDTVNLSDSGRITGAHSNTLTIAPMDFPDSGAYDVVVNGCGTATSTPAAVTVYPPPGPGQITQGTNGVISIKFFGFPNQIYVTLTATNLSGPWSNFSTNTSDGNGSWGLIIGSPTNRQQYYRVTQF